MGWVPASRPGAPLICPAGTWSDKVEQAVLQVRGYAVTAGPGPVILADYRFNYQANHAHCPRLAHDRELPPEQAQAADGLMACNDCGRPAFYCAVAEWYFHCDPAAECPLAGPPWGDQPAGHHEITAGDGTTHLQPDTGACWTCGGNHLQDQS